MVSIYLEIKYILNYSSKQKMLTSKKINIKLYKSHIEEGIKKANNANYAEAEIDFLKAIELDNSNHIGFINLSNIYIIQKKIDQCVKLLIGYIIKNDFHQTITCHAIKILHHYNYHKDLLKIFNLINLDSKKNFDNKNYLYFIQGLHYEIEKKYKEAKEAFSKSISSNKYYFDSYGMLFNLYESTNDFKKYNKLLNEGFKNFANTKHIKTLLFYQALYLNREKNFLNSQKIILQNDLNNSLKNNTSLLIKILDLEAKNNEKLKNYSLAFKKIGERNSIIANLEENKIFDGKKIYHSIDKYKIFFNKKNIGKINSKLTYQNDKNLVFLIGFPRSGTTLLDSILRSHSKINVLEEKPYLLNLRHEFFKQNNNNLNSLLNITQNIKDKIRNNYFKHISKKINHKKIIVDKFPLTMIELGFVKCIFPNAKIILAMRHPCDVVTSCYFSSFKINDAMINFLNWRNAIYFYNKVFGLFELYEKELNLQFLTVKYEDIIKNFSKKTKQLTEFLELDYDDNMKNFFVTARNRQKISTPSYSQVIDPLYNSSIDRWKKYPYAKEMEKALYKWIKKFKY